MRAFMGDLLAMGLDFRQTTASGGPGQEAAGGNDRRY
jgi:hypothetical protein